MISLWRSPLLDTRASALSMLRALDQASHTAPAPDEVTEDASSYTLRLEVPGIKADDIELDVTESVVRLSGERRVVPPEGFEAVRTERRAYTIERTLRFGRKLDPDAVEATLADGVLTVTLPKAEAAKPRRITIGS